MTDTDTIAAELERISTLRMQMLEMHPFWGYLLLQVKVVPAPQLKCIAATDCVRHIWFNPTHTRHLSTAQLGFVLAHEVGHQVFASGPRQRGRNPHLWNCATDYAINRIVAMIEHPGKPGRQLYEVPNGTLPELGELKILLDHQWEGMIAEAIYEYLAAKDLPEPVSVTLTLPVDGEGDGSGEGGSVLEIPNLTDHGGGLDVHLPEGLTPGQREVLVDRLAAAVGHWRDQGTRGDIPGNVQRRFRPGEAARLPWRQVLHAYAQQATARDDYSLARPNRRYLAQDLVVPGLYSERTGHIVVAVDTSGSVTAAQLDAVGGELAHLADEVAEMTLIVADAEVREVVTLDALPAYLARAEMVGGGGTDHRPVFDWVAEHRLQPDLFIGLTDLYSRFPKRAPSYPVLWVVPERHRDAPWGRVLTLR
jgi:predicted metal-dependent peptidase